MDNKLGTILLGLVLCLFCGGIGFVAGQRYERENSDYYNFQIDERGIFIEGRESQRRHKTVWPFDDNEK
jgi:hypothetical protein